MGRGGAGGGGGGSRGFSGGGGSRGFSSHSGSGGSRGGFSGGSSRGSFSSGSRGGFSSGSPSSQRPMGGGMPPPRPPMRGWGSPFFRPIIYSRPVVINTPATTTPSTEATPQQSEQSRQQQTAPQQQRGGCLTPLLVILSVLLILCLFAAIIESTSGGSSIKRKKLDAGAVWMSATYYEDHIGWVESSLRLEKGMKAFYEATGVQPYLYLTETINGSAAPTDAEAERFGDALYDSLFSDEGHFLVIFQEYQESGNYHVWCITGVQAQTVVDNDAIEIFYNYIDRYYPSDLDTSDYFSTVFEKTGKDMMRDPRGGLITAMIVLGIFAALVLTFYWWSQAKEKKRLEDERLEQLLKTPLEDLPKDPELAELEKKYEND